MDGAAARAVRRVVMLSFHNECSEQLAKGENDEMKAKAIDAAAVPPRARQSNYPEPFRSRMRNREKRALGDHFGLKNFGVNLTRLYPGGEVCPSSSAQQARRVGLHS